ncbi:MAG TPA: HAD family hydrolase [Candidatus Xenobia bacterium]|nr:HAD family hydrolase [Candidatus Xenobia bacterium]
MPRPRITTVVFDLDDTLYDCFRQRVLEAHRYASRKLLEAGLNRHARRRLTLRSLTALRLRLFREERNLDTLDRRLLARLKVGGQVGRHLAHVGRDAYFSLPVRNLRLFPDTMPTLRRLHRLGVRIYIITAGHLRIQRAKTRILGLDRSPYVRRILYTGLTGGRGKKQRLRRLLRHEPNPRRVLVVGDRPDSEIRAARELGMWAVRRVGGEFARARPARPAERARFHIRRVSQLFRLPFTFAGR